MANPVKGEVPLDIDGKRYIFVLGTYGLAALERRVKMSWPKMFKRAADNDWGIDDVLAVFHAGLLRHRPRMTEMEAADLIDTAGLEYINTTIGEAIKLMQPLGDTGGSEPENPPATRGNGGIGTTSSAIG